MPAQEAYDILPALVDDDNRRVAELVNDMRRNHSHDYSRRANKNQSVKPAENFSDKCGHILEIFSLGENLPADFDGNFGRKPRAVRRK